MISSKLDSFDDTKSDIVSSTIGGSAGIKPTDTWAQIIEKLTKYKPGAGYKTIFHSPDYNPIPYDANNPYGDVNTRWVKVVNAGGSSEFQYNEKITYPAGYTKMKVIPFAVGSIDYGSVRSINVVGFTKNLQVGNKNAGNGCPSPGAIALYSNNISSKGGTIQVQYRMVRSSGNSTLHGAILIMHN